MTFIESLKNKIEQTIGSEYHVSTNIPDTQKAWLTVPIFEVAKKRGVEITKIAKELASKLESIDDLDIEVIGGYVNIIPNLNHKLKALDEAVESDFGQSSVGSGQKIVIEFSGTNIAKPMSIGHLRSTIIGDSLQRIYRKLGFNVTSVNHLGDWGTQFGKLLVAYKNKHGDLNPREGTTIKDLLDLYVDFHKEIDHNSDLEDEARAMFKKLEDGNPEIRALWKYFVEVSLSEFEAIFKRLDVKMDEPRMGESSYEHMLGDIITLAEQKGVSTESEGAIIVKIDDEEAPLILRKKDGATIYATRDLAQVKYRVGKYHPNKILYVVANEQALHFRQYFKAAKMLGFLDEGAELVHVKFGLLRLPEGKMSTRAGRVIFLEDVLDEAVNRAKKIVEAKNPNLSEGQKDNIAEVVGIGAVKYFDLFHDRKNDIIFNWETMLSLKGDSATYLQYSYARANSILDKVTSNELGHLSDIDQSTVEIDDKISRLIKKISLFGIVISEAAEFYSPHIVAQYLNDLAHSFHSFYEQYPIIKAPDKSSQMLRLSIVKSFSGIIKNGLDLLGIKVVESM